VPLPVILAVDGHEQSLSDIERELDDRYSRSYRVVTVTTADDATVALEGFAEAGEDVAVALVSLTLDLTEATELFRRVRSLHPHAQRGLIIESVAEAEASPAITDRERRFDDFGRAGGTQPA